MQSLGVRELFGVLAENVRARVADGIDRVPYAVHQPRSVERLLVQETGYVVAYGGVGAGSGGFEVVEHLGDLDIRAAVPRTFERTEGRRHGRVGVRARTRHHMVGESGVVAAAVLGVEHQAEVEYARFEVGELLV